MRVLIACEKSGIVRRARRSRFFHGLAAAMADQWGGYALEQENVK